MISWSAVQALADQLGSSVLDLHIGEHRIRKFERKFLWEYTFRSDGLKRCSSAYFSHKVDAYTFAWEKTRLDSSTGRWSYIRWKLAAKGEFGKISDKSHVRQPILRATRPWKMSYFSTNGTQIIPDNFRNGFMDIYNSFLIDTCSGSSHNSFWARRYIDFMIFLNFSTYTNFEAQPAHD